MPRQSQSRFDDPRRSPNPPSLLRAAEATAFLGVKRATLYSYVSRGWVRAVADPDGSGNLYDREDLARLRRRHDARAGHGPLAAGALAYGEPVLTTRICRITAAGPLYRGRSAIELAAGDASFESVCELLWARVPADGFSLPLGRPTPGHAPRGFDPPRLMGRQRPPPALPRRSPLARMLTVAAEAFAANDSEDPPHILAVLAGPPATSLAQALALTLRVPGGAPAVRSLEHALILCAEHELTASTFATRIAASTGAGLWASLCAGLATLSGPRHGGAPPLVSAFVARLAKPGQAPLLVAETLRDRRAIPGFGNPLYRDGDPRGAALFELARGLHKGLAGRASLRSFAALADAVLAATGERPSLDFGLAALVHALGLAPDGASAIFGLGRSAGLIAHALEQRLDGRLLRPRARYLAEPESPPASVPPGRFAPPPRGRDR